MDNVTKAINLAAAINAPVETITFETIRSNENGAALYAVKNIANDEVRYVIEGETGTMLDPVECTEEEAIQMWDNA
jgi:hypothetical protein